MFCYRHMSNRIIRIRLVWLLHFAYSCYCLAFVLLFIWQATCNLIYRFTSFPLRIFFLAPTTWSFGTFLRHSARFCQAQQSRENHTPRLNGQWIALYAGWRYKHVYAWMKEVQITKRRTKSIVCCSGQGSISLSSMQFSQTMPKVTSGTAKKYTEISKMGWAFFHCVCNIFFVFYLFKCIVAVSMVPPFLFLSSFFFFLF